MCALASLLGAPSLPRHLHLLVVISRGHINVNAPPYGAVKSKLNPKVRFGERLRQLRKEVGLSQEALAYKAELDRSYVGGVERGEYNISLFNICTLADALGVPPHELLRFSDKSDAAAEKTSSKRSK